MYLKGSERVVAICTASKQESEELYPSNKMLLAETR